MRRFILLFLPLSLLPSCSRPERPVILHPEFSHADVERFSNLYPTTAEKVAFDDVDFRLPEEKGTRGYFLGHGREAGEEEIDRMKGYRPEAWQQVPDWEKIRHPAGLLQVTWLGHACFLIQFGKDRAFLTDPVLHGLPFGWLFDSLKRYAPPVATEKDLAPLASAVLISHNHYDHLDWETLDILNGLAPSRAYFAPLRTEQDFFN